MAIYTNYEVNTATRHSVFESSNLKATIVGNIYDGICNVDVDNGQALVLKDYTGDGLQTRNVTKAVERDQIVVAGTVPVIKDAFTKIQAESFNFYNKKGNVIRCYEVVKNDIFGVSKTFITGTVEVGKFVKVNASGAYEISDSDPSATNGFVGKVHSIQNGTYDTLVRILVLKNETVA